MMDTQQQCIRDAAVPIAEAYQVLYEWPLEAAAERVRRPGESIEAARDRVAARREARAVAA